MKLLISILLLLNTTYLMAERKGNAEMGKTIYKTIFKKELCYIGDDFVSQHTAQEWEEIFAHNGEMFKEEFGGKSKRLDALYKTKKFDA
ncbi:MAG: hypothetical protein OIF32_11115, partial [Campylobacterales bacterium]|nr:hypothetical protein [Campylobacterales bacterium]